MKNSITQEHGMGCAVACVAFVLGINYQQALKLFDQDEYAWTTGYYCKDIVKAFKKASKNYKYEKFNSTSHTQLLSEPGTIVFINQCKDYPAGHYLAQNGKNLWMNPWINFPTIAPTQSGFQETLPGDTDYIIFERLLK